MERLEIMSDNPDFNGVWTRAEVEAEMRDIGVSGHWLDWVGHWLDWVMDHNFDCTCPPELIKAMKLTELSFLNASVVIDGCHVDIKLMKVSN